MRDRLLLALGFVYALLLSLTLLRNLILPPGIVLHGDMAWPIVPERYPLPFYSWEYLMSAPQIGSSFALVYLMILLTQNVELVTKSLMLFTLFVWSFSVFYMTHFLTKGKSDPYRLIMCFSAGTIALLNPVVYSRFAHLSMLWGFGLAPLILVLFINGLECENGWKRSMVLAAILLAFSSIGIHAGVWNIFLLGCYFLYHFVISKKQIREVLWLLRKPAFLLAVYIGLTAYWVFPQFLTHQAGHPYFANIVDTVKFLSGRSSFLNVVRLYGIQTDTALDSIFRTTNAPLLLMTFIPALFAFSAILFRPKDKMVVFFTLLLPLILFLGQGTQGPLGNVYVWFTFRSSLSNFGWVLRDPNRAVSLLVISYAYLSAVTIGEVCKRLDDLKLISRVCPHHSLPMYRKLRKFPGHLPALTVVILFFSSASLSMMPMIQGVFSYGWKELYPMAPVQAPKEYANLNYWLREREGHFRVLWMPYDRGQFQYSWNHGANIALFSSYAGSRPSMYMIFSGIDTTRFLTYTYYGSLVRNSTNDFGKIISIMNMKYIIYHRDYYDYSQLFGFINDDPATVYESLMAQKDLKLLDLSVDGVGHLIKIFKNNYDSGPIFIPSGMMLLTGGLDGYLFLNTLDLFKPTDWGIIYAEQSPGLSMEHLTNSDIILFFNRDFEDLLFGFINKDYLIQLAKPVITQDPYSGWASYGVSSADLLQIWNFIGRDGISPDVASSLDFGQGYVFTYKEGARLDSRFTVRSADEYDLWARVLLNPNGGRMAFHVDNQQTKIINAYSQQDRGFTWVNLAKYTLSQGEHTISIINQDGKNAINLLAVISTTDSVNLRQKALRLIEQSSGRIFYVFDNEKLNRDEANSGVSKLSNSVFIPKGGNYSLFVQAEVSGSLEVKVEAITQKLSEPTRTGLKWIYAGSFNLSSGEHTLRFTLNNSTLNRIILFSTPNEKAANFNEFFSPVPAKALVTDYKITDPISITMTVNSSKPFLLILTESFNPLWSLSSGNEDTSSIPVYSFLNGFLVNKTGEMTFSITYKPQQLQTLSMYVSGFSFFVTLGYLSIPTLKTIVKKRKST